MNFQNNNIFGFDVSFYQRIAAQNGIPAKEISFYRMKLYGTRFVIIKAGQGDYKDPGFDYNWGAAKEAGIPRGSYFFEDKDFSPKAQANKYWTLIRDDIGEGICAMDFESGSHNDLDSAYIFLNEFQQLSGLPNNKIVIYTGYPYWKNAINNANRDWFTKFVLWEAWYPDMTQEHPESEVLIAPTWNKVTFWQDGTPFIGQEVGVQSKDIDHNLFNGTEEEFKTYFSPIGDVQMPEVTFTGNVKSTVTAGATVRATPAGADTGQRLAAGTAIQGTGTLVTAILNGISYKWMNIISPVSGWVADSLLIYEAVPQSTATHKLEVFVDGVLEYTKDF